MSNINQIIETAIGELVDGNIWPLTCPAEQDPNQWITYDTEHKSAELYGDDIDVEWVDEVEIHYYALGQVDYLNIEKQIRKELRNAGFTVTDIYNYYDYGTTNKTVTVTHLVFQCWIEEEEEEDV